MEITRRRVIAATGVVMGASLVPLSRVVDAQRAQRADDAVLDHVGREFARLYRIGKSQVVRAEHLQSAAANFRLMAVVFPNELIRTAAARANPELHDHTLHGRQAQEVRKRFGMDISAEAPPPPAGDRRAVAAKLAREGLGPTLLQIAESLERRAEQLALRDGVATPLRLAQWNPYCAYVDAANTAMDILCAASFWFGPQAAASCAVAVAAYWGYYYLCN